MPVRVVAACSALVLGLVLSVAGCSGSVDRDDIRSARGRLTGIDVSGTPGERPQVRIAAPLKVTATASDTLVEGTGAPVVVDQLFVLHLTLYDARTGEKTASTYDEDQSAMAVKNTDPTLFPALSDALVGLRQGGRLVMVLTADDAYGKGDPVVAIADVVAVPPATTSERADGRAQPDRAPVRVHAPAGLPESVRFPDEVPPNGLQLHYLLRGDGPEIRRPSLVILRSLAQVWGSRLPFDDSYPKEPALVPIGTGTVVRAWEETLVGVPRGSRVVIIAPPEFAFGAAGKSPDVPAGATIVYVVDVLGVS